MNVALCDRIRSIFSECRDIDFVVVGSGTALHGGKNGQTSKVTVYKNLSSTLKYKGYELEFVGA